MRKIIVVKDMESGANLFVKEAYEENRFNVGLITHNADRPNFIAKFVKKELDILIVPYQFSKGWGLTADDVEIEYIDLSEKEISEIFILRKVK